jgi:gamma-glutamyltranspeptidase/glutathione hydrolase
MAGVTFSNRLRSFNTTPGHPNCIEAGKRPRITLTPTLVFKGDQPVIAISVAGGDLQDQVTLNILLNTIEFGMSADQAVTAPRFATGHHQDSFDPNPDRIETYQDLGSISLNKEVKDDICQELSQRGHKIEVVDSFIGAPVMLTIDSKKELFHAAGDPSARRHAAGLPE